jgi:short-subunit dehydrogenase
MELEMNNKFLIKYGEWAIVTGASEGIGRCVAIELAKKGLNVCLVARRENNLIKLKEEIDRIAKVEVKILPLDLSSSESTEILLKETQYLNVGLFAAIAGFGTSGDLINADIKAELNMIDVNCRIVVDQTYYFAKRFVNQKRGGIILMGSLVGFQGTPFAANYAATKSFIQTFAEGIHFELKPFGVDVLSSAPGPVQTGFAKRADMKMGQAASPEIVAKNTLEALGNQVTVRPGFLSKFLGWSLIILPRIIRIRIMHIIMGGMTAHKLNS